jgi:hypothetical protein
MHDRKAFDQIVHYQKLNAKIKQHTSDHLQLSFLAISDHFLSKWLDLGKIFKTYVYELIEAVEVLIRLISQKLVQNVVLVV